MFQDTIVAIGTALSDGAISIIRLSGQQAIDICQQVFSADLTHKASHTMTYGFIQDGKQTIDEVLVAIFHGPKSYTTEDIVEIQCHGGIVVTQNIYQLLVRKGARPAKPGEFTQRAFYHGRIDLTQAEAINELIHAQNDQAASLAINGVKGSIKQLLQPLIDDLLALIAHIEVNIDYPEYDDVKQLTTEQLFPLIDDFLDRVNHLLSRAQSGQIIQHGINTVLIGKPNVGKSSLLNALLDENKAIVTDIAGTTRDIVEGHIQLSGRQFNLIDTAGIRQASDQIEQIGIEKSKEKLKEADLVILLLDASSELDEQDEQLLELTKDKRRLIVYNKTDIASVDQGISISAKTGQIDALIEAMIDQFEQGLSATPLLSNPRQIGLIHQAAQSLTQAKEALENGVEPDLAQIDITAAYQYLKSILGEIGQTDLLDALFSRFCLGK